MIRRCGKKAKQWVKDRAKLITEAVSEGKITIEHGHPEGICTDCGHWHRLDPDHRLKRSQGGKNDKANIDWICNEAPCYCHNKRDNMGDPKGKKDRTARKADWAVAHKCKNCKQTTSMLICHYCKEVSV
jgi:hypothetical protein